MTADRAVVRLERTFNAPPDRVYRAWLEPEVLRRWMAPGAMSVTGAEVDARVGGRFRVFQAAADSADAGGFESEFVDLVPNRRIVLRWRFVGPDRDADSAHDSLLTVTFDDAPDGATRVTLVHERLDALIRAAPDIGRNVETGWTLALDKLEGALLE